MSFTLPDKGFVFWPVGTGDSTTVVVEKARVTLQVDLHHLDRSDDDNDPAWPVVDELVRLLPKRDGRPYLSVFALTHPDGDHILGFQKLLKKATIGEIWHTPRVFRDYEENACLCEDAEIFREEVRRRRKAVISDPDNVEAGDRVRVIGHDDILEDSDYKDFPRDQISTPGTSITVLDDEDVSSSFEAFVHAPFKDDAAKSRNNTSLSLQLTLTEGSSNGQALIFGDREYPTTKQIFEVTIAHKREQYLKWDVLLSPHHCSRKVMYWQDEGEEKESFRKDMMDDFETHKKKRGYVIASSTADFSDGKGDNPPHQKARKEYEKIIDAGHFLCTHERPSRESPEPIKFEVSPSGLQLVPTMAEEDKTKKSTVVSSAISAARGGGAPPHQQVGFGQGC